MADKPNFGPYYSWPSIVAFSDLSNSAFETFHNLISQHRQHLDRPVHHLFLRIAYQAETTSFALRLDNTWAFSLPAFALTRIRLEQTIVCSYLIHEDESLALYPFVQYIPIQDFKGLQAAMEDSTLKVELSKMVSPEQSKAEAIKAQEHFNPGFSLENDKFERSWTKYDLRSMAHRRDVLAESKHMPFKDSLEREYVSIYKVASSIVHADASSLSYCFLDLFKSPSGDPVLMALPDWALIVAASCSHYDILQCYEILDWLKIPASPIFEGFMKQWLATRDQHMH